MKLIVKRSEQQKTGLLGGKMGVTFSVKAQAMLEPKETALISKYQLGTTVLGECQIDPTLFETDPKIMVTIGVLTSGFAYSVKSLGAVLEVEERVITACK